MHVLITRPDHDAAPWRTYLEGLGIAVSVDPMLEINEAPSVALELAGIQAIVATSRNALRWLARCPNLADVIRLPIYTVGPGSALAASQLGFTTIHEGAGTARELEPLIANTVVASGGGLLHLSGDKLAFDLSNAMAVQGISLIRQVVYTSQPASHLQASTITSLANGAIDTVALLSPLSAETFVRLLTSAGLAQQHQRLIYVCLSHNIADRLQVYAPARVIVASAPNAAAVLASLETLSERRSAC